MENASKALLIAGSILIVLLLIGVGILIFNSTSGMQEQSKDQAKSMEISTYNGKFTKYSGSQTGTQVKSLLAEVIAHNGVYTSNTAKQIVITTTAATNNGFSTKTPVSVVTKNKTSSSISNVINAVKTNGYSYTVTMEYDTDGYVSGITIK